MFESSIVSTRSHVTVAGVLDRCHTRIALGSARDGVEALIQELGHAALEHGHEQWQAECATSIQHPIRAFLHADPLTARAYAKPRGYSADGVLLDLFYRHPAVRPMWEALGPGARAIHDAIVESPYGQAIRWRMVNLARTIEQTAACGPGTKVLAVGAGHLRELELSASFSRKKLAKLVALDRDAASLDVVGRATRGSCTVPLHARLDHLLAGVVPLDTFHLIHVPSLAEELDDDSLERLIGVLFASLEPRGTLLLANTTPAIIERGYLEAFMGWRMRYRTPAALGRLIQRATGLMPSIFEDPHGRIGYARLDRSLS